MAEQTPEVAELVLKVADTVGGLMEFWGFKRPMGRVWALLYLSDEAQPAAEIGERLHMSQGGVSMTLAELQKWGVVRRTWRLGERKDFFEAETNVWKMISRVFRERELLLVRDAAEVFTSAAATLDKAKRAAKREEAGRLERMRGRVALLGTLARIGEGLISAIVAGQRIDPRPLRDLDNSSGG